MHKCRGGCKDRPFIRQTSRQRVAIGASHVWSGKAGGSAIGSDSVWLDVREAVSDSRDGTTERSEQAQRFHPAVRVHYTHPYFILYSLRRVLLLRRYLHPGLSARLPQTGLGRESWTVVEGKKREPLEIHGYIIWSCSLADDNALRRGKHCCISANPAMYICDVQGNLLRGLGCPWLNYCREKKNVSRAKAQLKSKTILTHVI